MKKIFTFLSISLFCLPSFAQDTTKFFYENGAIKRTCVLDSLGSGTCKIFYIGGELNVLQSFDRNELQGKQLSFFANGNKQSVEFFAQGSLNDSAFYFHENGNIFRKGIYEDDFYEGEWLSFHENGALKQRGVYLSGQPEGNWEFFDEKGLLSSTIEYKNGLKNGKYFGYYPNKKVAEERQYDTGVLVPCSTHLYRRCGKEKGVICH